jgi:charged multivesicular body protein 1
MDKFEQQFEDLDVRSAYMEGAMDQTTGSMTPENEVDLHAQDHHFFVVVESCTLSLFCVQVSTLIQMVADENGLEVAGQLDAAGEVGSSMPAQAG